MTAPRFPEDYRPLADAARPLLAGIVARMRAVGIDPSEAVLVVHDEACPCCAGKADRYRAPGALVGVAPRSYAAVAPKITQACRDALWQPLTPGTVLCLLQLRRAGVDHLMPMEVEVPRG